MPYRVDIRGAGEGAVERLIDLGALDVERPAGDTIAALFPDTVTRQQVAQASGSEHLDVSPAVGRDADSVWVLHPGPLQIGRLRIVPASGPREANAVRLIDAPAFGTGLHPTTALCVEAIEERAGSLPPDSLLDVGTGSGVLALSALALGVPEAVGIDTDEISLRAAAENARLNGVSARLRLAQGGPDALRGAWPLVVANILAAPLIEMAPALVRRVGARGQLVLSGISSSVETEVTRAYCRVGLRHVATRSRAGWVAVILRATW